MKNDNFQNLLKPLNQCEFTGLEQETKVTNLGNITLTTSKDHLGNTRVVYAENGAAEAAIMFDKDLVCFGKYTNENSRRKGIQAQLWAYCSIELGKIKHSEYLTDLGRLTVK